MRFHQRLFEAGLGRLPRPVWLEIDLDALSENVRTFREVLGEGPELSAVVKADAYGHGLVAVARAFEKVGVNRLCVASLDEAFALRAAGLKLPILVLFPVPLGALIFPEATDVEITLSTVGAISSIQNLVIRDREPPLGVHVEVETGLGRGGVKPELVPRAVATLDGRRPSPWNSFMRRPWIGSQTCPI
jgi:alanine racemase